MATTKSYVDIEYLFDVLHYKKIYDYPQKITSELNIPPKPTTEPLIYRAHFKKNNSINIEICYIVKEKNGKITYPDDVKSIYYHTFNGKKYKENFNKFKFLISKEKIIRIQRAKQKRYKKKIREFKTILKKYNYYDFIMTLTNKYFDMLLYYTEDQIIPINYNKLTESALDNLTRLMYFYNINYIPIAITYDSWELFKETILEDKNLYYIKSEFNYSIFYENYPLFKKFTEIIKSYIAGSYLDVDVYNESELQTLSFHFNMELLEFLYKIN